MASWLQKRGLRSMHKKTLRTIWAAALHVEHHITHELERYMSSLSESITRLVQAVNTEFDQIRKEAQAAADAAKKALEQVGSENVELKNALTEQVSKNENLVQQIDDARGRLDSISGELEGNDPHPDNTLPGPGSSGDEHPDNTLPSGGDANTGGDHIDNTLPDVGQPPVEGGNPEDTPHPDNTLPSGGDANTGGDHIDNTLPGSQPHPDIDGPGDQPEINPLGRGGRR